MVGLIGAHRHSPAKRCHFQAGFNSHAGHSKVMDVQEAVLCEKLYVSEIGAATSFGARNGRRSSQPPDHANAPEAGSF